MQALFVHGMGRSPLSGWPMLRQLKRAGLRTSTFGYAVSLEDFLAVRKRLVSKILALAAQEDYVLIGHSLGGVLLRAAVNTMPPEAQRPRHLFLLGSPLKPARLAQKLQSNLIYRVLTRDCGHLLGSTARMSEVGPVSVPTTSIAGVRGLSSKRGLFRGELNDGLVAVSEVNAEWIADQVRIPVVHTFLPSCKRVAEIILERVARNEV
jgi:pimeloyl-ACP methyl ester carboxylesterase